MRKGAIFAQLDAYIKVQANDFLDIEWVRKNRAFPLKDYKSLPEAIACEVVQEVYRRGMKTRYSLPFVKLQEITGMLSKGIGNKKIVCGGGGCFLLNRGIVKFVS